MRIWTVLQKPILVLLCSMAMGYAAFYSSPQKPVNFLISMLAAGFPTYFLLYLEISSRDKLDKTLVKSEGRHRTFMEHLPDPTIVYDMEGRVLYCNPAFEQMFGWSFEELIGEKPNFVPQEEWTITWDIIKRAVQGEPVRPSETRRLTKDGRILNIRLSTSPFYNRSGKQIGNVVILADITDLKNAEKALKESEERYRLLWKYLPDPTIVYDMEGNVIYCSPMFEKTFGWSTEELLGKKINFVPEEARTETMEKVMNMLRGERVSSFETKRLTRDGRKLDIRLNTAPFFDQKGEQIGNMVILRDVTELKQAEDAVRESEKKYRLLVETMNEGLVIVADNLHFQYVNSAMAAMLGYAAEEMIQRVVMDYVDGDSRRLMHELLQQPLQDKSTSHEIRWNKKNGKIMHSIVSTKTLLNDQGAFSGIFAVITDITDLTKTTEALRKAHDELEIKVELRTKELLAANEKLTIEINERNMAEAALRKSEETLKAILDASPIGIGMVQQQTLCWANRAMMHLLEGENEAVTTSIKEFFLNANEYERVQGLLSKGILEQGIGQIETQLKTRLGTSIDCHLRASALDPADGSKGIIISAMNITQHKLIQRKLIRSERLAATGQLAAFIAHEINSPLQGIAALLHSIRRSISQKEVLGDIELVDRAFNNIRDTVKNLLDLNRPRMENKQAADINEIIQSTMALFQGHLRKNKIKIHFQPAEHLPRLIASPQQLGQVMMNLINNSIEAISGVSQQGERVLPDHKIQREIRIGTELSGNLIKIIIADTGPGIAQEDLEHIFDPFYTRKKAMGMGVGLSICHDIIEEHGGSIIAENHADGGAVFLIKLPLKRR